MAAKTLRKADEPKVERPRHRVRWSVESGDFFGAPITNRRFNVVLMNPPFLSWDALTTEQRVFVRDILGTSFAGKPDLSTAFVMVWADERPNSAEGALRTLRRQLSAGNLNGDRSTNWSIYSMKSDDLAARKSWLPTPNALGSLLDFIKERNFPCVEQLFTVRQGIKTGLKEAFLVSDDELKALPDSEQKYFWKVASGDDILGGRVRISMYIFYAPKRFRSEQEMLKAVPKFGQRLLKYKSDLKKRTYVDPQRWWEAFRPKMDLAARTPRILTKMFGALNMAAVDAGGEFLPLQAFAWMPTDATLDVDDNLKEAALWWYCRILNSRVFFLLRREFAAAITAGGQLDVSRKYVDVVPLPMPNRDDLITIVSVGDPDVTASRKNDELVAAAYGTSLESWPIYEPN